MAHQGGCVHTDVVNDAGSRRGNGHHQRRPDHSQEPHVLPLLPSIVVPRLHREEPPSRTRVLYVCNPGVARVRELQEDAIAGHVDIWRTGGGRTTGYARFVEEGGIGAEAIEYQREPQLNRRQRELLERYRLFVVPRRVILSESARLDLESAGGVDGACGTSGDGGGRLGLRFRAPDCRPGHARCCRNRSCGRRRRYTSRMWRSSAIARA